MTADVEADIAAYAARVRAAAKQRHTARRRANPETHRAYWRKYRARNKVPVRIEWEPTAPRENRIPNDYRVRLDARISMCPGCDQWCFDQHCQYCLTNTRRQAA
jgi:hypothetical protein